MIYSLHDASLLSCDREISGTSTLWIRNYYKLIPSHSIFGWFKEWRRHTRGVGSAGHIVGLAEVHIQGVMCSTPLRVDKGKGKHFPDH